ncbi:MAG: type II toxin-antitoxin system VapC family toxin [Planctomycetota bacterium]
MSVAYLDSSALVKLVVAEAESSALRRHLRACPVRASCGLARVEVVRAVRHHGREAIQRARLVLSRTRLLRIDDDLLDAAAALSADVLRSLDAIHLAAALTFGDELRELVTYDARMRLAAATVGVKTAAPA